MFPRTERHLAFGLLIMFLSGLVTLLSILQLRDHYGFRTEIHDLGIMEQAIWQITQGNLDMPTSYPSIGLSRLARHRNLIFYLIAPFYALAPHSESLLLLTPLALAAACALFFKAARSLHLRPFAALAFAAALGTNCFIQYLMLFDFRADILAIPLFVAFVYSVQFRKEWLTAATVPLLLMVKEDIAFTIIALVPWVWMRWSRFVAAAIFAGSVCYWLVVWKSLPHLMNFSPVSPFWFRFSYLGAGPEEAVWRIITDPGVIWKEITDLPSITYMLAMFIQTGVLALLSPLLLLGAAPSFILNLLDQTNWQGRIGGLYYSGIPVTIIYLAALDGYTKLHRRSRLLSKLGLSAFLLQACILGYYLTPTPINPNVTWDDYRVDGALQDSFARIAEEIPARASIATQNNLGAHFPKRSVVTELKLPLRSVEPDYILLGMFSPSYRDHPLLDHDLGMLLGDYAPKMVDLAETVAKSKEFGLQRMEGPFLLFRRGASTGKNMSVESFLDKARADFLTHPNSPCPYARCDPIVMPIAGAILQLGISLHLLPKEDP